jgi:CheY-like chemotaxis protein
MDIQMPIMDGIIATKKIRNSKKRYKNIPIIALTANAMQGDLDHYLEIGMNDYISKPFNEIELYTKISNLLNVKISTSNLIGNEPEYKDEVTIEQSLYSLDYLKTVSNNNEAFIRKMIDSFIQKIPLDVEELKQCADKGNINRVKQLAHKLKNPIALLKINNLLLDIKDLEFYDEKEGPLELKKRVIKFSSFITLVIDRLKKDYDNLFKQ